MAGTGRLAGTLLRTSTKVAGRSPSPTDPVRELSQSSVLLPPAKETTYPETSSSPCQNSIFYLPMKNADKLYDSKGRRHNFMPDPLPGIQNERQRHHSLSPDENPVREFRVLEGEKMSVDETVNSKWNTLRWAVEEDGTIPREFLPLNKTDGRRNRP